MAKQNRSTERAAPAFYVIDQKTAIAPGASIKRDRHGNQETRYLAFCSTLLCSGLAAAQSSDGVEAEFYSYNSWANEYCGEIRVTSSASEVEDWSVIATIDGEIHYTWNGGYGESPWLNGNVPFYPEGWNSTVRSSGPDGD